MSSNLIIERIKPDMHKDAEGNIIWTPRLIDYNAAAYPRGHVVTSIEFNSEFLKHAYQGNYLTDTITVMLDLYNGLNKDVNEKADLALSTAETALDKANDAAHIAQNAESTANEAILIANTASSNIDAVVADLNNIKQKIPEDASEDNKLATEQYVDGIKNTLQDEINTANSNIETIANGLQQTEQGLTTLENKVDSHITDAEQAFEDIGSELTKQDSRIAAIEAVAPTFITKSVEDLVYYYKKSETYTQEEVNTLVSKIPKLHFEVVEILPETGDENVIYLVPSVKAEEGNSYEEYIYINNKFELIGTTKIDLTGYATETWVNEILKGYYTIQDIDGMYDDLIGLIDNKQDTITDLQDIRSKSNSALQPIDVIDNLESTETAKPLSANQGRALDEKIKEIRLFKFPNAVIIGEPTINNGQVSGFSANDYMIFPFILDVGDRNFQIDFSFTTGNDVTTQQNILDSYFGIALAIKDGKGLMAISGNGTSWAGSVAGNMTIQPNTTYYARLYWNKLQYKTALSTNGVDYTDDMTFVMAQRPYPRTIYIGGGNATELQRQPNPFFGIINMNKASLSIAGQLVWTGMDDVGLATRADVSLSNLDELGEKRFTDLFDAIGVKYTKPETGIPKSDLASDVQSSLDKADNSLPNTTKYGAYIDLVWDNQTEYKLKAELKNQDGTVMSTSSIIDLPLESVVVSGSYDTVNKKIILTLENGSTVDIPVGDLVAGLQSEITESNKLNSDLVDDTNQAHKFVSETEKSTWNGKVDKSGDTVTGDLLMSGIAASVGSSKKIYFGNSKTSGARAYVSANTNGTLALGSVKSDGTEEMAVWDAIDKAFRPASSSTDCSLGTSNLQWNAVRAVNMYQNGKQVANKEDIPNITSTQVQIEEED